MEIVCSALAGIGARLVCHPLDTVKTVAFTGFAGEAPSTALATRTSFLGAAQEVWAREGLRGFYRGVGVATLGSAPGVALYLSTYHCCSAALAALAAPVPEGTERGWLGRLAAATPASLHIFGSGFAAEAVSCLVWVPIDVSKERLQSQPPGLAHRYRGSCDALRRIHAYEGLRGLYKGYWSTLGSFGPFSAVYFVCYEYFTTLLSSCETLRESTFTVALLAGAGGNTVASLCTNPLELVKTRLQVQRAILSSETAQTRLFKYSYAGLRNGVASVLRDEGVRALWKGVGSRIAFTAPNAALTMGLYEYTKTCLLHSSER